MSGDVVRNIIRIQGFTIIWMSVEGAISLVAAGRARSPALLAFGGDSVIELLSAAVVFLRFQSESNQEKAEKLAAKAAGGLLLVLGTSVVLSSTLSLLGTHEARPSLLGIAMLLGAAFVTPWLARKKRELAAIASSTAPRADVNSLISPGTKNPRSRHNRCLEILNNFWMAHKRTTMSEVYSHLHEEEQLRLDKAARVGYGFGLPVSNVVSVVPIVPKIRQNNAVEVAA